MSYSVVLVLMAFELCESGWMDGSVSQKWARWVYAVALKCLTMKLENGFYLDAIESLAVWRNNGGCVWERSECKGNSTNFVFWQWVFFFSRHIRPSPFFLLRAPNNPWNSDKIVRDLLMFLLFWLRWHTVKALSCSRASRVQRIYPGALNCLSDIPP